VIAQLKDKGSVSRGWIGVQIQPVTADIADSLGLKKAEGALVAEPQANGPAAKAGIESGDVITAVNGETVKDARELARTIGGLAPGAAVKLNVLHKGQDKVVNLTLGQLPNTVEAKANIDDGDKAQRHKGTDVPKLGMTVAPANSVAGAGKEGVVVTEVDPKSAAAERGFKEGDVHSRSRRQERHHRAADVRDAITGRAQRQQEQRSHAREERRFVAVRGSAAGQGLNSRWRGFAGISRPRRRLLRGAGPKLAPFWLPFDGIRPPPSEG
jgi:serine protease Do